jgi:hypothetical protein
MNTAIVRTLATFPTPAPSVPVNAFMEGAITTAALAVAVFFLRYWKQTADRLFMAFAVAFAFFGASSIALYLAAGHPDGQVWVYALRAATFAALIVAVLDKNLNPRPNGTGSEPDVPGEPGTGSSPDPPPTPAAHRPRPARRMSG